MSRKKFEERVYKPVRKAYTYLMDATGTYTDIIRLNRAYGITSDRVARGQAGAADQTAILERAKAIFTNDPSIPRVGPIARWLIKHDQL